jgi:hypothetical protein
MGITNQSILRRRQTQDQNQAQTPGRPAAGPSSLHQVTNAGEEEQEQQQERHDDNDAEEEPEAPPAGPSSKARGKRVRF